MSKEFENRRTTAKEAVQKIKDGDRIVIGHACAKPIALTTALRERISSLHNIETGMGESAWRERVLFARGGRPYPSQLAVHRRENGAKCRRRRASGLYTDLFL